MKRGEIWTVSGGTEYTGKPRPAIILQDDKYSKTASVTICPMTSDATNVHGVRLLVSPSTVNKLTKPTQIQVDKVSTVSRGKLGARIGKLEDSHLEDLSRAVTVFLGL